MHTVKILAPVVETFTKPNEFRRVFGCNLETWSAIQQVERRQSAAESVCDYLGKSQGSYLAYEALMAIMNDDDNSARLALYVPFEFMYRGWEKLNREYVQAWMKLLAHRDVRESFNFGDIYEPEASEGEPERVVKCLHFLPWMIETQLLRPSELFRILDLHKDDELLRSSVYDCLEMFPDWKGLSDEDIEKLKQYQAEDNYERPKPKLLKITEARKKWLNERNVVAKKRLVVDFAADVSFSTRLEGFREIAEKEAENLKPNEVLLVGGSRVKGYYSPGSDYDFYRCDLSILEEVDPNKVHKVFDMFWISKDPEIEQKRAAIVKKYMELPADSPVRRDCLNRLESDLLQFRLMHKGFPYAYGADLSGGTKRFEKIDGASAFYDSRYREVASKLYAKYVFIPQL